MKPFNYAILLSEDSTPVWSSRSLAELRQDFPGDRIAVVKLRDRLPGLLLLKGLDDLPIYGFASPAHLWERFNHSSSPRLRLLECGEVLAPLGDGSFGVRQLSTEDFLVLVGRSQAEEGRDSNVPS